MGGNFHSDQESSGESRLMEVMGSSGHQMTTWIFQGNPDRFDIDGYLAFAPERITWLVNQYKKQIRQGDQVFLWRAHGSGKHGPAGIVAECIVDSEVTEMREDPSAIRFWRKDQPNNLVQRPRVWLRVVRVAEAGDILKKEAITENKLLKKHGTNKLWECYKLRS